MELTRLATSNLKLEFEAGDNFSFDSLDYPPSSAHSFSSASSSFGPWTPTSGRSTPPGSDPLDYTTSFSADPYPSLDFTPPSSAMSSYFPMEIKGESPCELFQPRLPVTPSRAQADFYSFSFGSCNSQTTPSQMQFYPFCGELAPSPLPATTLPSTQLDQNWDTSSTWIHADDEKPIFEDWLQPASLNRRLFQTTQETTTALHQSMAQQSPLTRKGRPSRTSKRSADMVTDSGIPITTAPSGRFFCNFDGCNRGYQRKEHLKRHIESIHNKKEFSCEFCNHPFNRNDNRKPHYELHTKRDRKNGRVKYHPGALKRLMEESRKGRKVKKDSA
ncbi:hypothetical protein OQA88_12020 [Cercophora sp. LCS_1]